MTTMLFLKRAALYSLGLMILIIINSCSRKEIDTVDLSGEWAFKIDSLDLGIEEEWFKKEFSEIVNLPGSMSTNGKGNEVSLQTDWTGSIFDSSYFFQPQYAKYREADNFKVPFWLQPVRHYVGAAWYKKTINIPEDWENKSVELFLERCHWQTQVWINNSYLGAENLLGSPHVYDISNLVAPGENTLAIRVDNSIQDVDVGINSHSVSDHTKTNWNGIIGELSLRKKERVHIGQVQIHPDVKNKKARVTVTIENQADELPEVELVLHAVAHNAQTSLQLPPLKTRLQLESGATEQTIEYGMGENPLLWDEFDPNLYKLNVALSDPGGRRLDTRETIFRNEGSGSKGSTSLY